MKYTILFLILVLMASCVSVKKQRSRAHGFFREFPEELAELCADRFPPRIEYKPGETVIKRDTVTVPGDSIPCPEIVDPDTGQKETPMVKCPDCESTIESSTRIDTVFIADKAREEQYRLTAERLQSELSVSTIREEEARTKARRRLYGIIGMIAIIGVYIFAKIRLL